MRTAFLTTIWAVTTIAFILGVSSCKSRQSTLPETVSTTKTSSSERPAFDDEIPMTVDDGEVNGPGIEATYAPTEYEALPVQQERLGNMRPKASNQCDFVGEVWDFAGEKGCSQVIETTNGYLLSVTGVPPGYYLEGGARIRFGFNYVEGSNKDNCTDVDASIRITCMQLLRSASGFPRPIVCQSYDQPSEWIYELIQDLSVTHVTRFPWDDGRVVYLFESPSGQYLYDCRGFILCQPPTNCLQFIQDFNAGTQIYEG